MRWIVGYCAENTLGSRIRDGEREVSILGERHTVRTRIEIVDSFSGHADYSELRTTGPKERVWLVHGEPDSALKLREGLMAMHTGSIEIATLGTEVEF